MNLFGDYFKDKKILITGGSSGMGKRTALMAKAEGAIVGVISNNDAEFSEMPEGFNCYQADIRNRDEVKKAVDEFYKTAGGIDMLINSAGVSLWKGFLEMDDAFWDLIYDVNVKGTFIVSQAVARYMTLQKSGVILNIASMSGLKSGMLQASAYASSKWAIVGFSRNLYLELKPFGIKVCCYCPGSTRTPLHEKANSLDMEKMLDPDEVAESILFMLYATKRGHIQLMAQPASFEEWR